MDHPFWTTNSQWREFAQFEIPGGNLKKRYFNSQTSDNFRSGFWLFMVGILWGMTNPLMKIGSEGINELPQQKNAFFRFLSEMYFLFTRFQVGKLFCSDIPLLDELIST
jgi:hypothetical protein